MRSFLIGNLTGGIIVGVAVYLWHRGKFASLMAKVKDYESKLGIGSAS